MPRETVRATGRVTAGRVVWHATGERDRFAIPAAEIAQAKAEEQAKRLPAFLQVPWCEENLQSQLAAAHRFGGDGEAVNKAKAMLRAAIRRLHVRLHGRSCPRCHHAIEWKPTVIMERVLAAVIVPHGVLFRGAAEGKIRTSLLEDNLIDAVIGLPAGLFQTTGIPVAILILDRSREAGGANEARKDVFFAEASREFKPGKARNFLEAAHLDKIVAVCEARQPVEKFCRPVLPEEIAENDYNLNITRYVDTFEEEDAIDIQANLVELARIDQELAEVEAEMAGHLKALGIANGG